VTEEPVTIDDVRDGCASGRLREVFACGTAAVIAPIGRMVAGDDEIVVAGAQAGDLTLRLRSTLLDLQHGRQPDRWGWMRTLDDILDDLGVAGLVPAAEPSLAR
jgi:branched-chain amino acid aminotransferase